MILLSQYFTRWHWITRGTQHLEIKIGRWHLPPQRGLVVVVLGASHPLGALGAVHLRLLLGVGEVPPVAPLSGELGAVLHLGHGLELPSCLVPE